MSRPKVLAVTHRVPYPPDKGDRIRTYHLLRFLARRAEIHLACLADEPPPPGAAARLNELCARVTVAPVGRSRWARAAASLARGRSATEGAFRSPELAEVLAGWGRTTAYDAAFASGSGVAPYLRPGALRGVPAVVDLVDVDSQKWLDYAAASAFPKSRLYRLEGRRLRTLEAEVCGWAKAVTLVSEAEAELFRTFAPGGNVRVVTNGVDLDYFRPAAGTTPGGRSVPNGTVAYGEGEGCVFVGAMDYRPNVDAACWFCCEVWPAVRRRRPGATFRVVGRRPAAAVRRLASLPGVEVVGPVPDVRPYLHGAAVAVAPLRLGRGLQNKVLEAMAAGRPVVASPQAVAGLGRGSGLPAVIAASPEEWAGEVIRLLGDPAARAALGEAGRRYAEARHDWGRCLAPFAELLGLGAADRPGPVTDPEGALAGQTA